MLERRLGKMFRSVIFACALFTALICCAPAYSQGITDDDVVILRRNVTGKASFVVGKNGGAIPVRAGGKRGAIDGRDFFRAHGQLFGISDPDNQLVEDVGRSRIDHLGHVHTTFQQIHGGIPVFSGVVKTHQDELGRFVIANGDFYAIPAKLNTNPAITRNRAIGFSVDACPDGTNPEVQEAELVIVDPGWYGDTALGARLAYYVVLADLNAAFRDAFFVDAHTGDILDQWSLIHTGKVRQVFDGQNGPNRPGVQVRGEGDPPATHPSFSVMRDINRAYDYGGDTYDYLNRAFGMDSYNDAGIIIVQTVNSQALPCPNASWNGTQMTYCLGAATDDVVAHEYGHAVTEFSANLIYQNQPGQLNESYSDVLGELVDLFNGNAAFAGTPGGTPWPTDSDYIDNDRDTTNFARSNSCSSSQNVRWLIGEDATGFGGAIRDMWAPPCFGHPDNANSSLQTCNPSDNGGVHSGSGIPNHAFAIVTDGKLFNGQNVNGIGPIKSGAVWFRALTTYLTPASDFADAYVALNQAAADLVGTFPNDPRTGLPSDSMFTLADAQEIDKALLAVEMNTTGRCGATADILNPAPPPICQPRVTLYRNEFENGSPGWSVSNSKPPTPYNWALSSSLPIQRQGTAWFCDDPNIGSCGPSGDESASHTLVSPPITLPAVVQEPTLAFTHYMSSEPGFDGGNIRIKIDDSPWRLIIATDFAYNPYNSVLQPTNQGNTNPFAGQAAFTGSGGGWGTSVVNLGSYVTGGETIRIRFDFGKDGCSGVDGWYMDDFEIFDCGCSMAQECDDGDPCTIDYCEFAVCTTLDVAPCSGQLSTSPAIGSIDARQPYDIDSPAIPQGWTSITFVILGAPTIPPDVFTVSEVGGDGNAPAVVDSMTIGGAIVQLTLDRPIDPGAWTVIDINGADNQICLGYLPGDVDRSRQTNATDITALINSLNGVSGLVRPNYATDINRSGLTSSQDITTLVNLLNGAGSFASWFSLQLGSSPCD